MLHRCQLRREEEGTRADDDDDDDDGSRLCSLILVPLQGLLAATAANGNAAGEGLSYLKSWIWWTGMSLMIIGEILSTRGRAKSRAC